MAAEGLRGGIQAHRVYTWLVYTSEVDYLPAGPEQGAASIWWRFTLTGSPGRVCTVRGGGWRGVALAGAAGE